MKQAAILMVPADWRKDDAVGISREVYERYREAFMGGLLLAVMKGEPDYRIVAQAELADGAHLADASNWVGDVPENGIGSESDYVLPIRLLYMYSESLAVPKDVVETRAETGDLYETGFILIDQNTYEGLFDRHMENEGR